MAVFASLPNSPAPAQIRDLVMDNPREFTLGFAVLIIPEHAPVSQGVIYAIHTLSRCHHSWDIPTASGTIAYLALSAKLS
jgi:hypothetical protein